MSMKINGGKALADALRNASKDVQQEASDAVLDFATDMHSDVVRAVQRGPASGVVYEKYTPRRTHQASAPGEAPMSDTGRLASSIYFQQRGKVSSVVGTKIEYAAFLEYGTRRMAKRPFFAPAFERGKRVFAAALKKAIGGALR